MIPLNPLYEVVPVTVIPDKPGLYIALRNEGSWQELWWDGFKWKQYEFGKNYDDVTHYLRPLPPERMEEWVKNLVAKAYKAGYDRRAFNHASKGPVPPDLQEYIDNLINEMSK